MRARVALLIMAVLLLTGACTGNNSPAQTAGLQGEALADSSAEPLAYGSMPERISVRVGFKIPESRLSGSDTNDNNPISRYLDQLTNIKVVHAWEAKGEEAFEQKISFAIGSNDMPDAMVVDRAQLRKLIDNDMIQDLTGTYAAYSSKLVRDIYASSGGKALEEASRDGKLYGLPNVAIEMDAVTLLWVRQDWLDRLGLEPPKTLRDIEEIAHAFVERDPDGDGKANTVGIAGDKIVVFGQKPNPSGFDSIFHAFHAFPKNWTRDSGGNVVYGSITPESKAALGQLADWYKQGLIDNQFVLYKQSEEPIVNGRAGMFFGPWWMPYWPLSEAVAQDTKAEWRAYAAPLDANGEYVTHTAPVTDRYLVVRKGYEYPEAVVKLLNVFTRLERRLDPNIQETQWLDEYASQSGVQLRHYYPFDLLLDYSDAVDKRYDNLQSVLEGRRDPATLDPDTYQLYEMTETEHQNPKKNLDAWKPAAAYEYGVGVIRKTPMIKVNSVFYGSTPAMGAKWATLEQLENETYLKIIVGDQSLDSFDEFVKQWRMQGGDEITKEIAELASEQ